MFIGSQSLCVFSAISICFWNDMLFIIYEYRAELLNILLPYFVKRKTERRIFGLLKINKVSEVVLLLHKAVSLSRLLEILNHLVSVAAKERRQYLTIPLKAYPVRVRVLPVMFT